MLGPSPRLDAADTAESTLNYLGVRNELLRRAGLSVAPELGNRAWITFIEAGFGYVDEKCNAFINSLFIYDRQQQALNKELRDVGAAATVFMGSAGASMRSLLNVAAAFNLAGASLENMQSTVLFAKKPSLIQGMLMKLRKAHRQHVLSTPDTYTSQARAMTVIGDYLNLCLPSSIEARIEQTIAETDFLTNPDGSVIGVSGRPDYNQRAIDAAAKAVTDARQLASKATALAPAAVMERGGISADPSRQVVRSPVDPPARSIAKNALTQLERMQEGQLRLIQSNLCVAETGDYGVGWSPTRQAIRMFKQARRGRGAESANGRIDSLDLLGELTRDTSGCDPQYFQNAYEKVKWATEDDRKDFMSILTQALQKIADEGKVSVADAEKARPLVAEGSIAGFREGLKLIERNLGVSLRGQLTFTTYWEVVRLKDKKFDTDAPPKN